MNSLNSTLSTLPKKMAPAIGASVLILLCIGAVTMASGRALALSPDLPRPEAAAANPRYEYVIGPQDTIDVSVFQIKDLTLEKIQVDGSGRILLPLIGTVIAAGKTAPQLADEIAERLRGKFVQDPQVVVMVRDAASQRVTVDGAVVKPGVYALLGPTTLLQAVALAQGPDNKYANLRRVILFRVEDGKRKSTVYNLADIRSGRTDDPDVRANDVVIVDGSNVKGAWREVLGALPGLAIFRPF